MIPQVNQIRTLEITSDYNQILNLPSNSILLDLLHRGVQGHESLTLVYQTVDAYTNSTSEYELTFNPIGYDFQLDKSFKYLATVKESYGESHYIVHWRRILSDIEKRELKIDHLLIQ